MAMSLFSSSRIEPLAFWAAMLFRADQLKSPGWRSTRTAFIVRQLFEQAQRGWLRGVIVDNQQFQGRIVGAIQHPVGAGAQQIRPVPRGNDDGDERRRVGQGVSYTEPSWVVGVPHRSGGDAISRQLSGGRGA